MGTRLDLHKELKSILGSNSVYYQPPESIKLSYPCIIYERAVDNVKYADNSLYKRQAKYTLTLISKESDPEFVDILSELPLCRMNRIYRADNLYHYSFDIYY